MMAQKVTKNDCFDLLKLANKYNIERAEAAITDFILKHFVSVSETEGFTQISFDALCQYLSSDLLNTKTNEHSVFKAAKRWILKNEIIMIKLSFVRS